MTRIAAFLRTKPRSAPLIQPSTKVREVLRTFVKENVAAAVVRDESGSLDGIVTERDIAHAADVYDGDLLDLPVSAIATTAAFSCSPLDQLADVAKAMASRNAHYIAVREKGRVCDVVGILDILADRSNDRRRATRAIAGLVLHAH